MEQVLVILGLATVFWVVSSLFIIKNGKVTFVSGLTMFMTFALMSKVAEMMDLIGIDTAVIAIVLFVYILVILVGVYFITERYSVFRKE